VKFSRRFTAVPKIRFARNGKDLELRKERWRTAGATAF
jgi:hypothetical protein